MYLVNYYDRDDLRKYRVRVLDVRAGKLEPGAIVDAREPDEDMRGYPVTRATSAGRPLGLHALRRRRRAVRPRARHGRAARRTASTCRCSRGTGPVSTQARAWAVPAACRPAARQARCAGRHADVRGERARRPPPRASSSGRNPDGGGVDWWIAGFFAAFALGVVTLARRRRSRVRPCVEQRALDLDLHPRGPWRSPRRASSHRSVRRRPPPGRGLSGPRRGRSRHWRCCGRGERRAAARPACPRPRSASPVRIGRASARPNEP